MDRYDNQREPRKDDQGGFPSGGFNALIPGMILVGIGALFLLDNLHIFRIANWVAYWPAILIAIGLFQIVDGDHPGRQIAGGIMMAAGGLVLAINLGYLRVQIEDLWPLILIAIGVIMLWTRLSGRGFVPWDRYHRARRRWQDCGPVYTGTVNEAALFGGSRRVVTDQDFKGGRVACVFGGVNLDLTGANMSGNTAVLELHTVYGGATVRIPTSWNLEVRGVGLFGGFADHTVHPPASPDMKHLIIRGAAVFGGVTFKN